MNVGYDSFGTECGMSWSGVCGGKLVVTGRTEQVNLVLIVNILRTNTRSSPHNVVHKRTERFNISHKDSVSV